MTLPRLPSHGVTQPCSTFDEAGPCVVGAQLSRASLFLGVQVVRPEPVEGVERQPRRDGEEGDLDGGGIRAVRRRSFIPIPSHRISIISVNPRNSGVVTVLR